MEKCGIIVSSIVGENKYLNLYYIVIAMGLNYNKVLTFWKRTTDNDLINTIRIVNKLMDDDNM